MSLLQDKDYNLFITYNQKMFDPETSPHSVTDVRVGLKTRVLIELYVHDSILPQIVNESSAHLYWVKLHDIL